MRRLVAGLLYMLLLSLCVGCSNNQKIENSNDLNNGNENIYETVLYQMTDDIKNDQMMSYIIRTKENKLIVIDGGYSYNASTLLEKLKQVSGREKPVVDGWFMTHPHSDHIDAFIEIMKNSPNAVEVNHVYYNFLPLELVLSDGDNLVETRYEEYMDIMDKMKDSKVTIVQEKDVFEIGSVKVEVLITPNEKVTENVINESSVIYRFTIEGQRVLFLGDAYYDAGNRLMKAYNKDLNCDVVQMAHHGSHGLRFTTYNNFNAKACLWPTPDWLWENNAGNGYNTGIWETIRLYEHMKSLGVKYHFIAKDGVQEIVFPISF